MKGHAKDCWWSLYWVLYTWLTFQVRIELLNTTHYRSTGELKRLLHQCIMYSSLTVQNYCIPEILIITAYVHSFDRPTSKRLSIAAHFTYNRALNPVCVLDRIWNTPTNMSAYWCGFWRRQAGTCREQYIGSHFGRIFRTSWAFVSWIEHEVQMKHNSQRGVAQCTINQVEWTNIWYEN